MVKFKSIKEDLFDFCFLVLSIILSDSVEMEIL